MAEAYRWIDDREIVRCLAERLRN